MKNTTFRVLIFGLIIAVLTTVPARSQSVNGRIEGTISDANGAVVGGAAVTVTNTETNAERTATTNDEGFFSFAEIAPGNYRVSASAQNFKTTTVQNVVVQVGTPATISVALEAGAVNETVTVNASDAQQTINTTNAETGDVVERRRVLDLPLDGRNPLSLVGLQAGADPDNGRVNGNRARALNITVNGINASDNFNKSEDNILSSPTIPVSVESVAEFRVTTSLATAEFGRGSAQVNVVTQGGTNDFRGSLFVFHRNTAFNANNFFNNRQGLPREELKRTQFGGRFGGPVSIPKLYNGRDKTFFFFSYEGTRLSASESVNRLVYTQAARNGDFRYLNNLATNPANVAANPSQIRTVNLYGLNRPGRTSADSTIAAILQRTDLPNNFDIGDGLNTGGFRFNASRKAPRDLYSFRFDHRFTDNINFELNYSYADDIQNGDVVNNRLQLFPAEPGNDRVLRARGFSTALNVVFSPALINEFRFGLQNPTTEFFNPLFDNSNVIFDLNTVAEPFQNRELNGRNVPVYQFIDNATFTRGNHLFKAGFDFRFLTGKTFDYDNIFPTVNFSANDFDPGLTTTNFPGISTATNNLANVNFAEALLNNLTGAIGIVSQGFNASSATGGFSSNAPIQRTYKTEEFDFYVQDTWKARSNLTLNFGLRYEFSTVPREKGDLMVLPVGGTAGVFGPTAPANLFVPGNLGSRTTNDLAGDVKFFKADKNNFAPVLSVAYQPFEKTSIRAGYRVSYVRENLNLFENIVALNPGLSVVVENNASTFLRNGIPSVAAPTFQLPLSLAQLFQQNSSVDVAGFNENLETPSIREFVVSVEREFFKDFVVEARYVGNRSDNLIRVFDINEVNVFAVDPVSGQSFLQAFNIARANLRASLPITQNNPLFARIFSGANASQATNTAITTPILNGEAGELADIISRRRVNNVNGNLLLATTGLPLNFLRPNPDVRSAQYADNASRSNYNALQIEIRRRLRQGFSFQANYTFGKELSDFTGSTNNNSSFISQREPDYEFIAQNPYHSFKANFIYQLPFGKGERFFNRGGLTNILLGGFQLGAIVRAESGDILTVTSGLGTLNRTGRSAGNAVDVVSGASLSDLRGQVGTRTDENGRVVLFDSAFVSNFANPQPGTLGNLGRGRFQGPSFSTTDFIVIKRTSITETQNIEFRVEFFNVFNRVNFGNPSAANLNINSTNFGVIDSIRGNPRIIQFAARYNF